MTVRELKEILDSFSDDMTVTIQTPAHDYWKTLIANDITDLEIEFCKWSDYHRSWTVLDNDDLNSPMTEFLVIK